MPLSTHCMKAYSGQITRAREKIICDQELTSGHE